MTEDITKKLAQMLTKKDEQDEQTEEDYDYDGIDICSLCGYSYCSCCGCDCWMEDIYEEDEYMKVKRLNDNAVLPKYAKPGDSGFDLIATEDVLAVPGATVKVPTGLAFDIPEGFEIQIRPRSGITTNTKLRVQFGTVDSGYRGEVGVTVDNIAQPTILGIDLHEKKVLYDCVSYPQTLKGDFIEEPELMRQYLKGTYMIRKGDKIAQGVLAPVAQVTFEESDELSETERGENGFGHSGVSSE